MNITKKTMMRLLTAAVLCSPSYMMAQNEEKTELRTFLVLNETNGTKMEFELTKNPIISVQENTLVIKAGEDELSTMLTDVANYTFEKKLVTTGITTLSNNERAEQTVEPSFSFRNAEVSGLKAGTKIFVYNLNGSLVTTTEANAEGKAAINFSSLEKGIYILHTPTKSFKIVNK